MDIANFPSSNYTRLTVNETEEFFPVNQDWVIVGIFWLPSVLLGLPINILVIFLGSYSSTLGNFRFAINATSLINALHCVSRAIVLIYYFFHYFFSFQTSLVPCTIAANVLDKWLGHYIVFYIPLLAAYRYILLCVKRGEWFLTKFYISIVIGLMAVLPTVSIAGRIYHMLSDVRFSSDQMCSYKYSDYGCVWCLYITAYGSYVPYALSLLFSLLLFVHLYRSFRKVGASDGSRRRLRDEIGILVCIVLHTIVPILLTIPSKGTILFRAVGIARIGSAFTSTLYNYNPLFDAVLTIICVKPYRRALLKIVHLEGAQSGIEITRGQRSHNTRFLPTCGSTGRNAAWSNRF